jgi:hypothetical protein
MRWFIALSLFSVFFLSALAFEDGKYSAVQDPSSGRWKVVPGLFSFGDNVRNIHYKKNLILPYINLTFTIGILEEASAWAEIRDRNKETGWYVLDVSTNPQSSNQDQAYGAGFVEVLLYLYSFIYVLREL